MADTLRSVLDALVGQHGAKLRVAMPATVVSYDPATQIADVEPDIRAVYDDGTVLDLPIISAPVQFPRGGGMVMVWRLEPGDQVWCLFADRSLDEWRATTGKTTPTAARKHSISDAVILPMGVRPSIPIAETVADAGLYVGQESTIGARLIVDGGTVQLGTSSVDLVAIVSQLITALTTLAVDPATGVLLAAKQAELQAIVASLDTIKA